MKLLITTIAVVLLVGCRAQATDVAKFFFSGYSIDQDSRKRVPKLCQLPDKNPLLLRQTKSPPQLRPQKCPMSQKTFLDSTDNRQLSITGTDPFMALVATAHDVVDRARILDSQCSRHSPDSTPNAPALQVTIPVLRD
jgi:hypothetical protein